VERQKLLAAKEHVDLISVSVPDDVTAAGLREALHNLATSSKVDAVWMLNDNGLVRDAAFVDDTWRAELSESKLPLIVGVPNLVEPSFPLGTLAVVPDHEALGLQAANLLFDLADNDWRVESHPVELPLSVKTVVDIKLVRANFGLRPDALKHIDKPLE
jgi:putative ABC transport system substrate-binding protein